MAEEKKVKEKNPEADARNWEARLRTEMEAPHKWAESWGEMFESETPHEYSERIKYLEEKLKSMPSGSIPPKYGVGQPFKEISTKSYKRKKMFANPIEDDDV